MWNRGAAKCEALKAEFGSLVTVAASPGEVLLSLGPPLVPFLRLLEPLHETS